MRKLVAVVAVLVGLCGCDQKPRPPETAAPGQPAPAESAETASRQEVESLQSAIDAESAGTPSAPCTPAASTTTNAVPPTAPASTPASRTEKTEPPAKPAPAAVGFSFGQGQFEIEFNDVPDLTRVMDFVKVTPNPGPLTQDWWSWRKACQFKGSFLPRTTYQVVVKAGLPMADGTVTAHEFRRTWRTDDKPQSVSFAAAGRYLPAGGTRSIGIKTVNVTNLFCQIRTVPLRNVIQLLAREEDCYGRYYGGGGDSSDAEELAAEPMSRTLRVKARLNEECTTALDVRDDEGEAANGVYLVSARNEDEGRTAWKLVCVTDIGLSVREANGYVYVWATSLTGGQPIKGLRVLVYGVNNVVMGEELTDAEGWCCCKMPEAGKPFAVVASKMDDSDTSFLAMRGELDESITSEGARREFVKEDGCEAFVWSDRGIYRHNEPILVHTILRNGKGNAPKKFPVTIALIDPEGKVFQQRTQVTDSYGVVARQDFAVADDQPSGWWEIRVQTPGDTSFTLGSRRIKIEEFVPPQIRVKVVPPEGGKATTNMMFTVCGEHLFGGPAKGLLAEASVMFQDAPFAPKGWEMFRFGDENRRLQPNFEKLDGVRLDEDGKAVFSVDFLGQARPRAAVKMTVQGSVFESGGRPASAKATCELHAYPFYIGVALPDTVRRSDRPRSCRVVLLTPEGVPLRGARKLTARFERVDCVYGLKKTPSGSWEWRTDRIRYPMGEEVEVLVEPTGAATLQLPVSVAGDCAVSLQDEASGVSFGASYWVGGEEDGAVRTALENPSRVELTPDKKIYYPGERPRIAVKAPFAGYAWLNVLREEMVYSQVLLLTNATTEVVLEPVSAKWTPSVDVALSVVQAVKPGARHTANRAFGVTTLRAMTRDSELAVKVKASVECAQAGGSLVTVDVDARGAEAVATRAAVTVVDEGINLLTDEKVPDPVNWFGASREAVHPLYDLYNRLLPILDENFKRAGAKTGGGADEDLFRRVSPVPTRRFKPLSQWKLDVPLTDGHAVVPFSLPEFVGEVRVTAVAYNARATGAGSVQAKVTPNLVMQSDAPRFAAPGDTFMATLTLSNRSGKNGTVTYDLMAGGAVGLGSPVHGELALADGQSETLNIPVTVGSIPGQGTLVFVSEGLGEKHKSEIELPVRPAAPWTKTAETVCLKAGESKVFPNMAGILPEAAHRTLIASGSPIAELASGLEYLVGYPHGCLEQTASRVFPLITAGGILNALPVTETSVAKDAQVTVETGVRRVCSMIRANDFAMWPDTDQAPWDREVSLWAAHFLVEASGNGYRVPSDRLSRVKGFLRTWSMSTNMTISIYACHTLALAGVPDRDRMLSWFDRRGTLSLLDRSRLARGFVKSGDRDRAKDLLANVQATTVKDAAFALLALLDLDPVDARIPGLVSFLVGARDKTSSHWSTTESNAHALLALGAYYRMNSPSTEPPALVIVKDGREEPLALRQAWRQVGGGDVTLLNRGKGPAFVTASCLSLPGASAVRAASNGIAISRRFLRVDGSVADLDTLVRGEMLVVETTLSTSAQTTYSDLVLEELLPACFEPDQTPVSTSAYPWVKPGVAWELRRDLRDDRVLGFSRRFELKAGGSVQFLYAVRVVSAGDFVLPGPSVEAMYAPQINARGAALRVKIAK